MNLRSVDLNLLVVFSQLMRTRRHGHLPALCERLRALAPSIKLNVERHFAIPARSDPDGLQVRVGWAANHPATARPLDAAAYASLAHVKVSPAALGTSAIDDALARRALVRGAVVTVANWFEAARGAEALQRTADEIMTAHGVAGLTGAVSGFARQLAQANVTISNLLPGLFDTDTYRKRNLALARTTGKPIEQVDAERLAEVPAARLGDPAEVRVACAWLCSVHSGYITGQNLLLDGEAYPGML